MSRQEGNRPPPKPRPENNSHGDLTEKLTTISCPWHSNGLEHPGGSPDCFMVPSDLTLGRVMTLGGLIEWLALLVGEAAPILNILWTYHQAEHGLTDEEKDEAQAEINLYEMGLWGEDDDEAADQPDGAE